MLELLFVALLAFGGISDPGWTYESPDGRAVMDEGLRFELPVTSGWKPRISGSLFAGSLDIELELTNVSGATIELAGSRGEPSAFQLVAQDEEGRALRSRLSRMTCDGEREGSTSEVRPGETCRIVSTFSASPFAPGIGSLFGLRNPSLERVTVSLASQSPAGLGVTRFSTTLVWID